MKSITLDKKYRKKPNPRGSWGRTKLVQPGMRYLQYRNFIGNSQANHKKTMRLVIQRVKEARVLVEGEVVGEIGQGLMVLVGFGKEDQGRELAPMAKKLANIRLFSDSDGRFMHSVLDFQTQEKPAGVLLVPQFTLYADCTKGRRPDFFCALEPEKARGYFLEFAKEVRGAGVREVKTGVFGANMDVGLVNWGPVTVSLEG